MGDNQARLEDIGQGRVEAMDAAGIDVSMMVGGAIGLIISLVFLMRRRRSAPARTYRIGSVYAPGSSAYTGCLKGTSCRWGSRVGGVRDE